MKKNYTHATFVVDRSGSTSSIKTDIIGGYNETIAKQKQEPGELTVSYYQFDDYFENVYDFVNVGLVAELTDQTFVPRGLTALFDSVAKAIHETGKRLAAMKEEDRPSKVLVTIITDGFENASHEYNRKTLAALIKEQETKWNWEFAYIGANQDAFAEGNSMGFGNTVNFSASAKGTRGLFSAYTNSLSTVRHRVGKDELGSTYSLSQEEVDAQSK